MIGMILVNNFVSKPVPAKRNEAGVFAYKTYLWNENGGILYKCKRNFVFYLFCSVKQLSYPDCLIATWLP